MSHWLSWRLHTHTVKMLLVVFILDQYGNLSLQYVSYMCFICYFKIYASLAAACVKVVWKKTLSVKTFDEFGELIVICQISLLIIPSHELPCCLSVCGMSFWKYFKCVMNADYLCDTKESYCRSQMCHTSVWIFFCASAT